MTLLIAGLGGIGQRHVRNLRHLLGDRVSLLAYRVRGHQHVLTPDFHLDATADVLTQYNITAFASLDEALARRPDGVLVCNPSSEHAHVALAAARAGCHLFIEKPVTDRWDDAQSLIREVTKRKVVALVGYQMRFHPAFRQLQAWVASEAAGRVVSVLAEIGERITDWHPYEDYRDLYAARREQGGGVILSQIHEYDYLHALFGRPRRAMTMGGKLSGLDIAVEDTASVLLEYSIGGRGVPVHLHQDFVQRPPVRCCSVVGDAGRFDVDFLEPRATRYGPDGAIAENHVYAAFERNDMFLDEMRHWLACLAGESTPITTVEVASESLRVALAARESLESGQPVTVA